MRDIYPNETVIEVKEIEESQRKAENGKCEFAAKFSEYCKANVKSDNKRYKTRDVAELLGISYENFRKIIDMNRPTKNRDLIIALCAVLGLDVDETNEMLILYNHMPSLDFYDNPRESLIMSILDSDKTLSVDQINNILISHNLEALNIPKTKQSMIKNKQKKTQYVVRGKRVKWVTQYDWFERNPYQSLETDYLPTQYSIVAEMWIEHTETNKQFILSSYPSGNFSKLDLDAQIPIPDTLNDLKETDDLYYFFEELRLLALKEFNNKLTYLDDTKYFDGRISAKLQNQSLYVYTENYDYYIPELNEYYLMEYYNGEFILSIYQVSMFMKKHLTAEQYSHYYKPVNISAKEVYRSIEEIAYTGTGAPAWETEQKINSRKSAYKRMKTRIIDFIDKIRRKDIYIRNLPQIYDSDAEVLQYYNLEEEFHCTYDEEYGEIIDHINEIEWSAPMGSKTLLTFEDICNGFELGIDSIDEICQVKHKYGSVWDVIPNFQ